MTVMSRISTLVRHTACTWCSPLGRPRARLVTRIMCETGAGDLPERRRDGSGLPRHRCWRRQDTKNIPIGKTGCYWYIDGEPGEKATSSSNVRPRPPASVHVPGRQPVRGAVEVRFDIAQAKRGRSGCSSQDFATCQGNDKKEAGRSERRQSSQSLLQGAAPGPECGRRRRDVQCHSLPYPRSSLAAGRGTGNVQYGGDGIRGQANHGSPVRSGRGAGKGRRTTSVGARTPPRASGPGAAGHRCGFRGLIPPHGTPVPPVVFAPPRLRHGARLVRPLRHAAARLSDERRR